MPLFTVFPFYKVKPVFFKDWKDKNLIRNAIPHEQALFDLQKDEGHLTSLFFDKSTQKNKTAYDKKIDFNTFRDYLCEIIDAENSLFYSLYLHVFLMSLITIARGQEKLRD